MRLLNHRTIYSTLFYVLVILLIITARPAFAFDNYGSLKPFGVGDEKSIFSLGVVTCALAIVSFYIFTLIDIMFGENFKPTY